MMNWLAFDADDTLWKNERTYIHGRNVLIEILAGYGIRLNDPGEINSLVVKNIKYYGYGAMSYVLSLIEIAIDLTDKKIHPGDIQRLLDLGKDMLSEDTEVFGGVTNLLEKISTKYHLMLITKGDLFHQQRKIEASGLGEYFSAIEIVSEKSAEVYLEILERYQIKPENFIMVGNSLRSDILPVLELGGYAVHLTGHLTWSYEDQNKDGIDMTRYLEVQDISEVYQTIMNLDLR